VLVGVGWSHLGGVDVAADGTYDAPGH
jgi:hypothetical protein